MANDFRSMDQHPLGVRQEVTHLCPECGGSKPLCPVCLGTQFIPADRLDAWCREQNRKALVQQ